MKKIYTMIVLLWSAGINAQTLINEQYASSVIDFSSQYGGGPGYHAIQALGAPNAFPVCSDSPNAWTSASAEGQREFLVLGFTTPQPVNTVRIYQNVAAGAIDTVYLRNSSNGVWTQIYVATAAAGPCASLLEIRIATTTYNADAIRIAVNSPAVPYWNEIDAVGIANFDIMAYQWQQSANSVIAVSSQYGTSPGIYSPEQALGSPTIYPNCGDNGNSWLSLTADGQREYIVLGFANPSQANRIRIHQNVAPGAIDTVYLREAGTGVWHMIYSATATLQPCPQRFILELNFTKTTYNVDAVRIALNSPDVAYWNEIDGVELQSNLLPSAKSSVQAGDWSSSTTWAGGIVPGPTDTVVLDHNVTVDASYAIKSIYISPAGILTMSGNSLALGPNGGGKETMQVQGGVNISGGILRVNGSIEFQAGSSLTMSGGEIIVDGNDGSSPGSVANGIHLFELKTGMSSVAFTTGTITIIDPQYHASGQAIAGNYTFGPATILNIGNGSSSTSSNNTSGFGGNSAYPGFGNLIIDAVTDAGNRHFTNGSGLSLTGNCTVTTGKLRPAASLTIGGDLTVMPGATIQKIGGNLKTNGNLINNGTITVAGGNFSVVNNFTNNTGAVYTVTDGSHTSVGNDLLSNGSFTSFWLLMANDFATSSNEQTIGGTGTFIVYGLEPLNNHANGVSILIPMTVERTFFPNTGGKLFLGNNDLTVNDFSYGSPNDIGYIVLNGTGKLINNNVNTDSRLFPVGTTTSYTPVLIDNGSGHNFSVSVKSTFTFPPNNSAIVNREWNITDITGGAVSADITFQWNASDENGAFDRTLCHVGHHNGTTWHKITGDAAAGGADPYSRMATGVSVFSPFAIGSNSALPVHLLSFNGSKNGTHTKLTWESENENDLTNFEIERSTDNRNYLPIGTRTATNQPGRNSYTFNDVHPAVGANFYRLKQLNIDGSFSYSRIVKVDFSKVLSITVYPNPAKEEIFIQGDKKISSIQLVDIDGKVIKQFTPVSSNRYNIGRQAPGIYFIRISSDTETEMIKLVIQ